MVSSGNSLDCTPQDAAILEQAGADVKALDLYCVSAFLKICFHGPLVPPSLFVVHLEAAADSQGALDLYLFFV